MLVLIFTQERDLLKKDRNYFGLYFGMTRRTETVEIFSRCAFTLNYTIIITAKGNVSIQVEENHNITQLGFRKIAKNVCATFSKSSHTSVFLGK